MNDKEFQNAVKLSDVDVDMRMRRVGEVVASALALIRQARRGMDMLSPSVRNVLNEFTRDGVMDSLMFLERNAEDLVDVLVPGPHHFWTRK